MGSAGDSLPTRSRDDPPTGTVNHAVAKRPPLLTRTVAPVRSGESPDSTGESPVLLRTDLSDMLSVNPIAVDRDGDITSTARLEPSALPSGRGARERGTAMTGGYWWIFGKSCKSHEWEERVRAIFMTPTGNRWKS